MKIPFTRQLVLGIILGAFCLTILPAPAQAQWLTFDKPNWLLKLEEMAREVDRWATKIEQYNKMYEKAEQRLMRLTNIMQIVDEQLARNKRLVVSIAGIARLVRRAFQLQKQFENMVRSRIISVNRLWGRLRNGIFDPQQNLRDLEEYLKNSLGRTSEDAVANLERLARMDNEFERMQFDLNQAYARLASAQELLKQYEQALAAEMGKPENERHAADILNNQILLTKQLIEQINKQISDLMAQITERAKKYGMVINQHADFGNQVDATTEAFETLIEGKKEILDEIEKEFEPDEGIIEDEDWF